MAGTKVRLCLRSCELPLFFFGFSFHILPFLLESLTFCASWLSAEPAEEGVFVQNPESHKY
jgi:hypothetical protein